MISFGIVAANFENFRHEALPLPTLQLDEDVQRELHQGFLSTAAFAQAAGGSPHAETGALNEQVNLYGFLW